jgi:predicted ATPase
VRVYFCAGHSCGKTTLARYVSLRYELPLLPEVARQVLSERELNIDTLRADLGIVDSYQQEVFTRQIAEEKRLEAFVSDRSAIDALAYIAQHSSNFYQTMQSPLLKPYIETLKQSDVRLFFVRPSKATLKEDGVRETPTYEGVLQIDAIIKCLLELHGLKYFQINTDSMQERCSLINSVLSLAK